MTRRWLTGWPRNLGMTFFAGALLSGAFVLYAKTSSAKQAATLVRGNKPGEWRYWGADAWSSRYSALDQINAANFDSLQVAWQWNAGVLRRRRVLSHDAALRERASSSPSRPRGAKPSPIDPATGTTLWQWGLDEGIRWQKAPRQFAGRGLAYWTDGHQRARHRRDAGLSPRDHRREDGQGRSEVRQGRRRRPHGRPRLPARAARRRRLGSARGQ